MMLLALAVLSGTQGMLMQPANPETSNWDTWLFINSTHINYFYLKGTNCTPSCLNHIHGWDGVGLATSALGAVHFTDVGTVLEADRPATPDRQWLGSGSVYRTPAASVGGVGAPYIMSYSQGPGAGARPTTASESQKIYFATSHDLNTWTKTDAVFATNTSLYTVAEGGWDCLTTIQAAVPPPPPPLPPPPPPILASSDAATGSATVQRTGVDRTRNAAAHTDVDSTSNGAADVDTNANDTGSLYGYFFARSKANGGGGFARSVDGIHWTALESVHAHSASSVFQFEDRLWLTAVTTMAGPGESPYGPFGDGARVNDNGRLVSMGFLRAWTINSTLVLLTHQHVDNAINGASSYLGVIKQVMDVPDQVPRCWWWPQNNGLYGVNLYLTQQPAPEDYLSSVQDFRLQPGVIVEVIGGPGVLIETSTTSTFVSNPAVETRTLTALLFNYAGRSGSSDASSNTTMTGGIQYDGGVEGSDGDSGCFSWGAVRTVQPFKMEQPTRVVCRGLPSTMDAPFHYRVLIRNHRSRAQHGATADTDAVLIEYYVNDVLGDTLTMPSQQATGRVGAVNGVIQVFSASFS